MKKERILYLFITIIFLLVSILILRHTNLSNNVLLSKSIEIIIILYLFRISYGCSLYIKKQFKEHKYSYGIIMNLGLLLFLYINIFRHIDVLIENWNILNIHDIYNNTLESFSFFAFLTLPCILIISIYGIITNMILIKKEGFSHKNMLSIFISVFAILGLFGSQAIYMLTKSLCNGSTLIFIKKLFDIIINASLSYFYCIIIATLFCNIKAAKHIPNFDKDYIIILGCKINEDGTLTPLLKSRVEKALEFAKLQKKETGKDIIFVPSGGQGKDEVISEADAMAIYLKEQGINSKRIVVENKSTSTIQNMKYANDLIKKKDKDAKVVFSTTNYHVFRSGVIASECGFDYEGIGSKTKWYFYTNALIREFIANLVQERKRHIGLMMVINISSIILILIGYFNQLIAIS